MKTKPLTEAYKNSNKSKIVDMSAVELAGYYLTNYKGDPLGMLSTDISNLAIPMTTGQQARTIITSMMG